MRWRVIVWVVGSHAAAERFLCQVASARFDQIRIKLSSCSNAEDAVGHSVPDVRGIHVRHVDGIERIGDRQDSGSEGDVGSTQPVGITCSVPSLMVMGDQHGGLSEKPEGGEQFRSDPRVTLDGGIHSGVPACGFSKEPRRKSEKADVVK